MNSWPSPTEPPGEAPRDRALAALRACGVDPREVDGPAVPVSSPIDGEELVELEGAGAADAVAAASRAAVAFAEWRTVTPDARAAAVSAIARELGRHAPELAELIAIETGKPLGGAVAEVEAAVDLCARAAEAGPGASAGAMQVGRFEALRPLGPVAVLGSFELPLLHWATAAPLALACGDPVVWLPGAPLVATAVAALVDTALDASRTGVPLSPSGRQREPPPAETLGAPAETRRPLSPAGLPRSTGSAGLHALVLGEADAAEALAAAAAIALAVEPPAPAANVAIVAPGADLDLVAREALAATVAGAGRSPAALRLLLAHESLAAELEPRLAAAIDAVPIGAPFDSTTAPGAAAIDTVSIGDPLDPTATLGATTSVPIGDDPGTVLGPLRDLDAYRDHLDAVQSAEADGGELLAGGEDREIDAFPGAHYAEPALVRVAAVPDPATLAAVRAPVLFLTSYVDLDDALAHRDTMPRAWSALLGGTPAERSRFLAAPGSDCGFVALGSCPGEAEVIAATALDHRAFTRKVAGRVD